MSLSFAGLSFGSHPHGPITAGPWDVQKVRQQWFGVTGEAHLVGRATGRQLSTWLHLTGYASHSALATGIAALSDYLGVNGTLTITIGADTGTYTNVTFESFSEQEAPFLDGSGVNGWQTRLQLIFRQIKQ